MNRKRVGGRNQPPKRNNNNNDRSGREYASCSKEEELTEKASKSLKVEAAVAAKEKQYHSIM